MAIHSALAIESTFRPQWRVCASPNHGERKNGKTPNALILHYTGLASVEAAVALLRDPASEVSAHYVVTPDGEVLSLVAEERRAWHAGRGCWAGETDMNDVSIGVEIAHAGHKDGRAAYPYPDVQIDAVIALCRDVASRWPIPPHRVLAHSDTAPDRKIDPGEFFPWARLAQAGVGHYAAPCPIVDGPRLEHGAQVLALQGALARYGYGAPQTGLFDERTSSVVRAFQRHFRPELVDGVADFSTIATLHKLLAALDA